MFNEATDCHRVFLFLGDCKDSLDETDSQGGRGLGENTSSVVSTKDSLRVRSSQAGDRWPETSRTCHETLQGTRQRSLRDTIRKFHDLRER